MLNHSAFSTAGILIRCTASLTLLVTIPAAAACKQALYRDCANMVTCRHLEWFGASGRAALPPALSWLLEYSLLQDLHGPHPALELLKDLAS